jgi:DNA-binding NtrC family response regulator
MVHLLVYSRDEKLERLLAATLGPEYSIRLEADRDKVQHQVAAGQVDVLILDLESDRSSLDQVLGILSDVEPTGVPVLVMTGDDRRTTALELVQHGVYDHFRKPPHLVELKIAVRRAHAHAQLRVELESTRRILRNVSSFDQLIGSSRQMREVYDLIRRVAPLNANVLITGESGTGKELVARAIHNTSSRAKQPFVAVSCGAIPDTLIEAELFGHHKGAFTGATVPREGHLEQAGGGTLLLDEIGELSLHTQVKLLRVLQEREFCKLGSSKPIPLRARVLLATHRNLDRMVEEGTFRQDLYFRVNVLRITVPPLRDRPEDIPLLTSHFLDVYSRNCGKRVSLIRPTAMKALQAYHWPGNVRELENIIHSAVALAEGPVIELASLPDAVLLTARPAADGEPAASIGSFEEQLRDYKRRLAEQALVECNGNKTDAARRLNITRAYLYRLLRLGSPGEPAYR